MAMTARRVLLVAFLAAIVATETRASSAFLIAPSSSSALSRARHPFDDRNKYVNRGFGRTTKFEGEQQQRASTLIRGGAKKEEEEEALEDVGGSVAGLFGNLRIPASLVAGASLGSAFALPFLDTDSAKIGMAKRLYVFSMVTTLGSMLLVIIVSTISMNDITIRPKRLSKSVSDYIEENYWLEWTMARSHFFYGCFAFLGGSAFRAYISIACPVFGKGVLGILASLSMICMSYLIEKTSGQMTGERPIHKRFGRFLKAIGNRAKSNPLFGAGAITWVAAVTYLIYKTPHMYVYIVKM